MSYKDAIAEAVSALDNLAASDPLRPIAFQEVLKAVLTRDRIPGPSPKDLPSGSTTRQDAGTPLARLSSTLKLSADLVERVIDIAGDVVTVIAPSAKLPSSKAGATEIIALLVCAGRQGGLAEKETPADVIRAACIDFGRYDEANFASTLRGLSGDLILGGPTRSRSCRLTRSGFERASQLVATLGSAS